MALSMIPDLTRRVGVPRLLGVSHPMGQPYGPPHEAERQRAVLRAMLELVSSATGPDTYVEMPGEWPQTPGEVHRASRDVPPPPIAELLKKKPWLLPALYSGQIPQVEEPAGQR